MVGALFAVYLVCVALMIGSFINLAADRLPRGESLVLPRSHCRTCGRHLNFIDLLPVAGYVIRAGRCATCTVAIGPASPAIEATAGAAMALAILWQGVWPGLAAGLGAIAILGAGVIGLSMRRHRAASGPVS
jgi:prepilin signal peptidase PulO-like enzyme (type II secretory pathway)